GSVALSNGSTLSFGNMEPFDVGGGIVFKDLSAAISAGSDVGIAMLDGDTIRVTTSSGTHDVVADGPLWLYLGDNADVTTISSLATDPGFSLMIDAGEEIVVDADIGIAGSLGLSAKDITIAAGADVVAGAIDIRAIDWSRVSLDAG